MIHRINDSIEDHIEWDLYDFVSFFWAGRYLTGTGELSLDMIHEINESIEDDIEEN